MMCYYMMAAASDTSLAFGLPAAFCASSLRTCCVALLTCLTLLV